MADQLTFDAGTHTYRHGSVRVPSVTAILRAAGLGPQYGDIDPAVLERARQRGVAVDAACDLIDADDLDEASVDPAIAGYVEAYRRFIADTGYTVRASQVQVHHAQLGYCGTADMVGRMQGRVALLDRKCTASMHPDVAIQVAAYAEALNHMITESPPVTLIAGLHLRRDGSYKVHTYDLAAAFNVFRAALVFYQWRQDGGKL